MKYILIFLLSGCIIYDGKLRNKGAKVYKNSVKCHYHNYQGEDQENLSRNCGYRRVPIQ